MPKAGPSAPVLDAHVGPNSMSLVAEQLSLQEREAWLEGGATQVLTMEEQIIQSAVHIVWLVILYVLWAYVFCCAGSKRSTRTATAAEFTGDMQPVGLCSCWTESSSLKFIFEAMCCPMCLFAETVEHANMRDRPWPSQTLGVEGRLCATGLLSFVTCSLYDCYANLAFRVSLLGLPKRTSPTCGTCTRACCELFWCYFCALRQQADFVELFTIAKKDDGESGELVENAGEQLTEMLAPEDWL